MSNNLKEDSCIRWGIIGCGDVTEKKSGPGFQNAKHSKLVAVMRRDASKAEDYAKRHSVPKWYSNVDDLINDSEVDAVYIATPPSSHCELALKVAKVGKPCYVEKPMALSVDECQAMIDAFQQKDVPLFVAYYRRALPRFLHIKSLLDQNGIGDINMITLKCFAKGRSIKEIGWRVDESISGGGLFHDVGCHTLDLLDFLFGDIILSSGSCCNRGKLYQADDIITANFVIQQRGSSNNIPVSAHWCFCASYEEECVEVVGRNGTLQFAVHTDKIVKLLKKDGSIEIIDIPHPNPIQQPMIQEIVDELIAKRDSEILSPQSFKLCSSTGISALRTNKVMEDLKNSSKLM